MHTSGRFCNYLDRLRPSGTCDTLQQARAEIRKALMELCGTRSGAEQTDRTCRTSRGLDAPADLSGLVRLLQDASGLKRDLAETFAGAFLAVRAPNSASYASSSYRGFLIMARQCQVFLRRHVDDLFKACLGCISGFGNGSVGSHAQSNAWSCAWLGCTAFSFGSSGG